LQPARRAAAPLAYLPVRRSCATGWSWRLPPAGVEDALLLLVLLLLLRLRLALARQAPS
jgi:hypothetical protein